MTAANAASGSVAKFSPQQRCDRYSLSAFPDQGRWVSWWNVGPGVGHGLVELAIGHREVVVTSGGVTGLCAHVGLGGHRSPAETVLGAAVDDDVGRCALPWASNLDGQAPERPDGR